MRRVISFDVGYRYECVYPLLFYKQAKHAASKLAGCSLLKSPGAALLYFISKRRDIFL